MKIQVVMDGKDKESCVPLSCVDCGTQNCRYQTGTYPEFCLTTHLDKEDWEWALERYTEEGNHKVMVASAEVEYEGVRTIDTGRGDYGICPENRSEENRYR